MNGSEPEDESEELGELAERFCREVREGKAPDVEAYAARYPEHADDIREVFPALELLERSGKGHLQAMEGHEGTIPVQTLLELSHSLGGEGLTPEVLGRIVERGEGFSRYELKDEVARGGQGKILRVWDKDLHRDLAMKVVLAKTGESSTTPRVDSRTLGRFLEEAQVTGQLDHPGIVPVHELGIDDHGRVYFTMKLVKGQDLKAIFDLVHAGEENWTRTRALGVLLRVCEAMSYAHAKGVIHRDLKPGNVMVGKFGEVYVMDWGLARVTEGEDDKDLRIREDETDLPLATMDGDVLGTPAYMSPEQAWGTLAEMGPHSDVYSVGAMIYHLLVGHPPHGSPEKNPSNKTVLGRVREGPPAPLHDLTPAVPQELEAICERAMERDVPRRYADMAALGEDLRAYLEGRVVHAYESGAVAELKKWVKRNELLAGFIAATFVALAVGLGVSLVLKSKSDRRADEVLRLSALQIVEDLVGEVDALWPAVPDNIPRFEDWVLRARELVDQLPEHEARLAELQSQPANAELRWWTGEQAELVDELHQLESELLDPEAVREPHGWSVGKRLRFATELRDGSGEHARAWEEATTAIAAHPDYDGLRLEPQLGLVPLGPDPESGLWEFADLQTGVVPERAGDGALSLTEESSLVFVLLPGGTFTMGAQSEGPHLPNFDPEAHLKYEYPPHAVVLDPFFVSKAELTQGQWRSITGGNPSVYYAGRTDFTADPGHVIDLRNPVESVSWFECERVLARLGFLLPTGAQWEYAARAGSEAPWFPGETKESLEEYANIADAHAQQVTQIYENHEDWLDDGFAYHAPVGRFLPNDFGLWDVHGNVWEWCRDWVGKYDLYPARAGDGLREVPENKGNLKSIRGGSFQDNARDVRVSRRATTYPGVQQGVIGLRPARAIRGELR